jgi:hypothetical protein
MILTGVENPFIEPSASIEIVERALLPFDFARFKVTPRAVPPITTLPP